MPQWNNNQTTEDKCCQGQGIAIVGWSKPLVLLPLSSPLLPMHLLACPPACSDNGKPKENTPDISKPSLKSCRLATPLKADYTLYGLFSSLEREGVQRQFDIESSTEAISTHRAVLTCWEGPDRLGRKCCRLVAAAAAVVDRSRPRLLGIGGKNERTTPRVVVKERMEEKTEGGGKTDE